MSACVVGTGVDGVGVVYIRSGIDWSKYINPAIINIIAHEFKFLWVHCYVSS